MSIITTENSSLIKEQFLKDTLHGLSATPKHLQAKYFYDERGDYIFQQIMEMGEYYLTNSEMEILREQSSQMADLVTHAHTDFDLIELGAGDATKSIHLLKELLNRKIEFSYLPIDISGHVIDSLEQELPAKLPGVNIRGLNGDYLVMLQQATTISDRRKVVLFMGANIGNMEVPDALAFCQALRQSLAAGDLLIIGFDLKKNPAQILAAYNDNGGITSAFNLNLLTRMNRELDANFNLESFTHYASYDPESGACKSYLISLKDQLVQIGEAASVAFKQNEYIYMEISQKYALEEIEALAVRTGFQPHQYFFDSKRYFVDAVWKII